MSLLSTSWALLKHLLCFCTLVTADWFLYVIIPQWRPLSPATGSTVPVLLCDSVTGSSRAQRRPRLMGRMKERLSIRELEPNLSGLTEADLTAAASLFTLAFQPHDTPFHCSETASLYQYAPPPGSWTPRSPLPC